MSDETKKILILLNDPDPFLTRVLKNKFQKDAGWDCLLTESYNDALTSIIEQAPNAVITDLILKDSTKTGFDLIRQVGQATRKEVPIIVFSELRSKEDKQKAESLGATHYFVKSEIDVAHLIEEVEKIVNG